MDEHTLDMEVFARSLTKDQLDVCESDEGRLGEILSEGISEANAVRFARAMHHARRFAPGAAVGGVIEVALEVGLSFIVARSFKGLNTQEGPVAPAKKRASKNQGIRGV